jgi:hypothetical protein
LTAIRLVDGVFSGAAPEGQQVNLSGKVGYPY